MSDLSSSTLAGSMRTLLSRRALLASAGTGTVMVLLGRSVVGKEDAKESHKDDKDHDDDHDGDVTPAGTVPAGSAEVRIDDDDHDGFEPGTITIDLGQSVTWVNVDDKPHTATGADFDTGKIDPGQQATVTFDEPGSFPYSCSYHPVMTGTVDVRDESGKVPAGASASPQASPQASPASGQKVDVEILNFAFEPQEVRITAGTTVEWTNKDAVPHTATATDKSFESGMLEQGDTFSHTFEKAGTFDYFCEVHPNMKAKVVVSD